MGHWGRAFRDNWPEYAIEAFGLATILFVSAVATAWIETGASRHWLGLWRRLGEGLLITGAMVILIYSPWGRQSGAQFNPSLTLTLWWLKRMTATNALFYVAFQVAGAVLGLTLAGWLVGARLRDPPVTWIVTRPGAAGTAVAFAGEFLCAFLLVTIVLVVGGRPRLAKFTGLAAALLVLCYICLEAPYSGFGMNPARSFASAVASGVWTQFWVYLLAPTLGMLAAARINQSFPQLPSMPCAKLMHDDTKRCIHCGLHVKGREYVH